MFFLAIVYFLLVLVGLGLGFRGLGLGVTFGALGFFGLTLG